MLHTYFIQSTLTPIHSHFPAWPISNERMSLFQGWLGFGNFTLSKKDCGPRIPYFVSFWNGRLLLKWTPAAVLLYNWFNTLNFTCFLFVPTPNRQGRSSTPSYAICHLYNAISSNHGNLLDPLATPVTVVQGWHASSTYFMSTDSIKYRDSCNPSLHGALNVAKSCHHLAGDLRGRIQPYHVLPGRPAVAGRHVRHAWPEKRGQAGRTRLAYTYIARMAPKQLMQAAWRV